MPLQERLSRYFELKEQQEQIKQEMTEIRDGLKELAGSHRIDVYMDDGIVRFQNKRRSTRGCDWKSFKVEEPGIYERYVHEGSTGFLDIHKIAPS